MADAQLTELAAGITEAYVSKNRIALSDLESLISSIYAALGGVAGDDIPTTEAVPQARATPAQIRRSISQDALISFEDNRSYRTLKRHLGTYGLTFEAYKEKWGLPKDYPSVAPSYSEARSAMAKQLGLGRGGIGRPPIPPEPVASPKARKIPAKSAYAIPPEVPAPAGAKPGRKPRATKAILEAELLASSPPSSLPELDFE